MTTPTTTPVPHRAAGPSRPLPRLAHDVLHVLYRHRMLTTRQLAVLLTPHTTSPRYVRRVLGELRAHGLTDAIERRFAPGGRERVHFLTPTGATAVHAGGELTATTVRRRPVAAGGALDSHTLAVAETGVAMVAWARHLGHECGPLDWRPEVRHRLGPDPAGGERELVADAVLHYTETAGERRRLHTWFVELDRGTEPAAVLAGKLRAYARYAQYVPAPPPGTRARTPASMRPAWSSRYPRLPHLLVVLADLPERRAQRRIADVRALVAHDPRLTSTSGLLAPLACTLPALRSQGPTAPSATPLLGDAAPRPLLGADGEGTA